MCFHHAFFGSALLEDFLLVPPPSPLLYPTFASSIIYHFLFFNTSLHSHPEIFRASAALHFEFFSIFFSSSYLPPELVNNFRRGFPLGNMRGIYFSTTLPHLAPRYLAEGISAGRMSGPFS